MTANPPAGQDWEAETYDTRFGFVSSAGHGVLDLLAPTPANGSSTSAAAPVS